MGSESFPNRLKLAMGSYSGNAFAKLCGFSESLIRQYLSGQSLPGIDKAIRMAEITKVNLLWLAAGEGPMRPGESGGDQPPVRAEPLSAELLKAVIKEVKDAVAAGSYDLSTSQEAELITGVYQCFSSGPPGAPISKSAVEHLLRAINPAQKEKR